MKRKYVIPLRREWLKVPIYHRSRKAVKAVSNFISKHMKNDDVRIGKYLNLKLWSRGNRNPPHKVEVIAEQHSDKKDNQEFKFVRVELVGAPKEEKKAPKKKKLLERLKDKVEGKEDVVAAKAEDESQKKNKELAEEVKEEKQKDEKVIQKEQEKRMEARKAPKKTTAPKKSKKEEVGIEKQADQFPRDKKK